MQKENCSVKYKKTKEIKNKLKTHRKNNIKLNTDMCICGTFSFAPS